MSSNEDAHASQSVGRLTFKALSCHHSKGPTLRYRIEGYRVQGYPNYRSHPPRRMEIIFQSNTRTPDVQPDGVSVESLLRVLIHRLESKQATQEACVENSQALQLLRRALQHSQGTILQEAANEPVYVQPKSVGTLLLELAREASVCTG